MLSVWGGPRLLSLRASEGDPGPPEAFSGEEINSQKHVVLAFTMHGSPGSTLKERCRGSADGFMGVINRGAVRPERSSGGRLRDCHCDPSLLTLAFAMEKGFGFKASFEVQAAISKTKGNKTKTSPGPGWSQRPPPSRETRYQGRPPRGRGAGLFHRLICGWILQHSRKVSVCLPEATENY